MELTNELYDKLITSRWLGKNLSATPWVLVFVNKNQIDSKRAVMQYRDLARYYEGKVRFAWVDRGKAELLAESFGVTQLPATFLIKNGMAYHYRLWAYAGDLHDYIEKEGYYNSTLSFKQPARFLQIQLYLYAYPVRFLFSVYRYYFQEPIDTFYIEQKWEKKIKPKQGAIYLYRICFTSILVLIWLTLKCINRKKPRDVFPTSESAQDVMKKNE